MGDMNPPHIAIKSRPNIYGSLIQKEDYQKDSGLRAFSGWLWGSERPENEYGLGYTTPSWLTDIHNKYSGRCFLLGTGPSLISQVHLLPKLIGQYTFTCNRMRLWGAVPFKPFVHCVTEPQPFLEWGLRIISVYDHPEAQNKVGCIWWPIQVPGWLWCPKAPSEIQMRWQGFGGLDEKFHALPTGWASPLTISQLAAWMGFTELIFLGIDTSDQGQAWDAVRARAVYPRNIRSICECFERARIDLTLAGRKVYDCTPGGRINREGILPYVDLAEVLADTKEQHGGVERGTSGVSTLQADEQRL